MNTNQNRKLRTFALALVLAVLAAPAAWAQLSSNASLDASATMSIPLEIYQTGNLSFGELIKTRAHDVGEVIVTLTPDSGTGVVTSADSSKVSDPDTGDHTEGAARFSGDPSEQVIVTLPATVTLEKSGATTDQQRMDLDLVSIVLDLGTAGSPAISPSAPNTYPMPPGGNAAVEIGGDLHVKFDNESGVYSGTIPVSLNYL